ncbi:hypothetical protein [Petrimonas sp.]|uniref:hypothetical protein n=1 Tax=Petrimonas sp. TaxID=2023866 RepID=UPI003F515404
MKNKKSLFAVVIVISALVAVSCSGNKSENKGTLTVENILSDADNYLGKTVNIEGVCSHVCSKSGMKMFVADNADGQTIRVESNSAIGKFDRGAESAKVFVRGKLVEDKLTEADLQEMEKEVTEGTAVEHGEGGAGCETEQKAEGTEIGSSEMDRINAFRARIAERQATEGKDYLSFYHIEAESYKILK